MKNSYNTNARLLWCNKNFVSETGTCVSVAGNPDAVNTQEVARSRLLEDEHC